MISRKTKAAFYLFASPFMRINSFLYRAFRKPKNAFIRVHLGPGQKNYISSWINVDANIFTGKCDIWSDLRYKLPFPDLSIDAIYSHHVVEHLPNLKAHFSDVYRCLKPGGVYRVGGPNGDTAIQKFIDKDTKWFSDFPDNRNSIGGRFENFIFCRQEHLTILTFSYLEEIMTSVGFTNIRQVLPTRETNYPDFYTECLHFEFESDFEYPHTLLVEAEKSR